MSSTDKRERIISRFIAQVTSVGGQVVRVADLAAARDYIVKLATACNAKRIVVCGRDLAHKPFPAEVSFGTAIQAEMPREDFFEWLKTAEIGVTTAELGVAETGTIILSTSDESERLATALPRVHVALLPIRRLVSSLQDAEPHVSSFLEDFGKLGAVSLISGPSRTADIEGRLVVGVHGPRELHVCLLDQELAGGR